MPLEAKPLFRPDVLQKHLAYFNLSAAAKALRPALAKWAGLIESKRIDDLTEKEILPSFLTLFFNQLLGFTDPADSADRYTISREKHVEVDGKFADAVLGVFGPGGKQAIVALEGKGSKDPLERPFAGRKMSAVDQAYRYAINLPCDWIIVTSMHETRLYHKGSTQQTYERFDTVALAEDQRQLEKFVFLLAAERIAPLTGRCHLYDLLTASVRVGREVTKEYYVGYANLRQDIFELLCQVNQDFSRHDLLQRTQKLLDRILFCAFCKDRGLLPADIIGKAYQHRDPYNPRPIWDNFRGLFQAVDQGNSELGIDGYNGGLFEPDPLLDTLKVPNEVCAYFRDLGGYDYRPPHEVAADPTASAKKMVDVEILGHIFEQSITDLEKLRNELDGLAPPLGAEKHKTRRKKEGAFYTPQFITRYIIEQALGPVLKERFERLRRVHAGRRTGANKAALADPNVYNVENLTAGQRAVLMDFWKEWENELTTIRLLDPACGSGAFLIEAFTHFRTAYQTAHDRMAELRGHIELFDLDRQILEKNLFGVDLNHEAIEICRLSLWIRTAERGKTLTNLDPTIRVGNSVVSDPAVHPLALNWQAAFPHVFAAGGFDVVVGNPPYVRQELLGPIKPYLETTFKTFHGVADLYVYFYELGLRLLKTGGRLGFITSNSFFRAGYGEPLRHFLVNEAKTEQIVDLGDTQIFEDAKDVYPAILIISKEQVNKASFVRTVRFRRDDRTEDIGQVMEKAAILAPLERLRSEGWQLENPAITALRTKLTASGLPLPQFAKVGPLYGVKTGFNEAFVVDPATHDRLIREDPTSEAILKRYLRGQDIERWCSEWAGEWMIFARSGIDIDKFPAIKRHLEQYRVELEPKPKGWSGKSWAGRKPGSYQWFELQDSVDYWQEFEKPKIMYPDIAKFPRFSLDKGNLYSNNTVYFLPVDDFYLLGVLNSPTLWFVLSGISIPFGERAGEYRYRLFTQYVEQLPIPIPTDEIRFGVESAVRRVIAITTENQAGRRAFLDWLRLEFEIDKPSMKLQAPAELDEETFLAEVKKLRGKKKPLTMAAVKALREEYARELAPLRRKAAEAQNLERQISDLVNAAYGLTPEEVTLMWQTAPPRMPIIPGV